MKKLVCSLLCLCVASTAFAGSSASLYAAKCAGCHGQNGNKIASASGKDMLKGQSAQDIQKKLTGYADGSFGGKKAKLMSRVVNKLNKDEIPNLSKYISEF